MNLVVSVPVVGNLAVATEMRNLLAFMDRIRDIPPEEQLDEVRRWIGETIREADGRWGV
jgi:hypothetical protein